MRSGCFYCSRCVTVYFSDPVFGLKAGSTRKNFDDTDLVDQRERDMHIAVFVRGSRTLKPLLCESVNVLPQVKGGMKGKLKRFVVHIDKCMGMNRIC